MTSLVWGASGDRIYESGVDRGVLFPPNGVGVAWNGLTGVSEAPVGGAPQAYYLDGIKYLQIAAAEEYAATITAFSAPPEFAQCDGTGSLYAGLFITQQPRKPFNFSYRTMVGNDVDGLDAGYKLHLVYNALAKPSQVSNASYNNTPSPNTYSWGITTVPILAPGFKPSAHLVIDSRISGGGVMWAIESMLYGTDTTDPVFPTIDQLLTIFESDGLDELSITAFDDGSYMASGTAVTSNPDSSFAISSDTVVANNDGSFTIHY